MLSFEAMPADEVCRSIELVRALPGVEAIVSARHGGFYETADNPAFLENAAQYSVRRTLVTDLLEFCRNEPVCKVAVYCKDRAEEVLLPAFHAFAETSQLVVSGEDWMDLTRPGISKGLAFGALCKSLHISPSAWRSAIT